MARLSKALRPKDGAKTSAKINGGFERLIRTFGESFQRPHRELMTSRASVRDVKVFRALFSASQITAPFHCVTCRPYMGD
jgi:hypothetical protein